MSAVSGKPLARKSPLRAHFEEFFSDVSVRQGFKMALAGTLGFAASLWLRFPNPTWCLFTVLVLMMAQYVGAIAEKAMLRAVGTFVGATIGILLVGNFASTPFVIIGVTFAITAVGTMMFGGNRYPYAFFLGALTMLVVVGNTMKAPEKAWHIGTDRILEITLGILVCTAVTGIVWPRYARLEFRKISRNTLRDAGKVALARSRFLLGNEAEPPDLSQVEGSFAARMNSMRLLLRFGQRESEYFRAKLPLRLQLMGELAAVYQAAESLGQRLPDSSQYRQLIRNELEQLESALEAEFTALTDEDTVLERENTSLAEAVQRCDARLLEMRASGISRTIPVQEAMDFSAHYTTLVDISTRLEIIRRCIHDIRSDEVLCVLQTPPASEPFRISPYWIRNGIKGGLSAVLALIYVNWMNPPGGITIPFAAWLLTATTRLYPGGEGDRRAFSYALKGALAGIPFILLLFIITPLLANYLWMNLFLATGLFSLGYLYSRQGGISLYGQLGMLFFVGAVGLNPQEPVSFQSIINVYFGVVIALVISACIQRLLWPLLPQREIFSLFSEFFNACAKALDPSREPINPHFAERLTLIPTELAAWIRVTTTPDYPVGETARLHALLHTAERLAYAILASRKLDAIKIPPEIADHVHSLRATLSASCQQTLEELTRTFSKKAAPSAPSNLLAGFEPVAGEIREIRLRYLRGEIQFEEAIPFLGAMNFLEDTARTIDQCVAQARKLRLDEYRGDYAL